MNADRHMNGQIAVGRMLAGKRGESDYKPLGVIIGILALAVILLVIVWGLIKRGFG